MHADEWAEAQRVVEESKLLSADNDSWAEFERVTADNERLRNKFDKSLTLFFNPPPLDELRPEDVIVEDDGSHNIVVGKPLAEQLDDERKRSAMWKRFARTLWRTLYLTNWRLLTRCGYEPTTKMVREDLRLETHESD
jgi:hypothetical protein